MAKQKTTAVALTSSAGIPDILGALEQEFKDLKRVAETPYQTQGQLDGFGNIKDEKNIGNLIKAYSSVVGRSEAYDKAQVALGVKDAPEFQLNGGTVEAWKHDIQLRIQVITQDERFNQLKEFKKQAEELMDKEDKKKLLLDNLGKFLKKNEESAE